MTKDEEKEKIEWWLFLNANPIGVDEGKDDAPTKEELNSLPENVKQMLLNEKTSSAIYLIGQENQLTDQQTAEVARTLREICFGNLNPAELKKIIEERVNLTPEIAEKVSFRLTKELISPNYFQISQHYRRKNEKKDLTNQENKDGNK